MSDSERPIRERLASEIGLCQASDLRAHLERDAVIMVHSSLDLLEVAVAVAEDRSATVREWIVSELLAKPSAEQVKRLFESDTLSLRSVIVRPYVLVQELRNTSSLPN
jgi:hypothetical protein